jgi:hypothetical protein
VKTEVKTLHKQQNSRIQSSTQTSLDLWNTTVGYGFRFKRSNPRTLPIQGFAYNCRRALVRVEYGYPETQAVKEEIRHYSSQYSARLIIHPNDLVVNLMAQPDNRRLRRRLPNGLLPDSFLICSLVFKV